MYNERVKVDLRLLLYNLHDSHALYKKFLLYLLQANYSSNSHCAVFIHERFLLSLLLLLLLFSECRDQGIARPKVLILLPFRSCAVQIVETMSTVMFASGKVQ